MSSKTGTYAIGGILICLTVISIILQIIHTLRIILMVSDSLTIIFSIVGIIGANRENFWMVFAFGIWLGVSVALHIADLVKNIIDITNNASSLTTIGLVFDCILILLTVYFAYVVLVYAKRLRDKKKADERASNRREAKRNTGIIPDISIL